MLSSAASDEHTHIKTCPLRSIEKMIFAMAPMGALVGSCYWGVSVKATPLACGAGKRA